MPRQLTAAMISYIWEQAGFGSIALLDVQTVDGTQYFWTDNDFMQWPVEIGNGFNLLTDPDMLLGTTDWTLGIGTGCTVSITQGAGFLRGAAFRYVGTGASQPNSFAWQLVNVTAGVTYTLSGYIDATHITAGNPGWSIYDHTITTQLANVSVNPGEKKRVNLQWTCPGGTTQVVVLCDTYGCTVSNGTNLDMSNPQFEVGSVANRYCGANYSPWLKSVGPLQLSKSFTTDAGDIVVQNLSGNSIDRDVAAALQQHEFEGALGVLRLYLPLFDGTMFQFHGYLSEQQPGEEEVVFRLLQLSDFTQYNVAEDVITDLCTFRYKSAQCGSSGSATSCPKTLVACQDATRAAQERFNGILLVPPASAIVNPPPVQTTPGPRGPASGGGGAGVGGVHGRMALA